uniref:RWD domain-containing protein 3 n=1 Tax=Magallana gigas TaxID=29159 RepID=A0A8W8NYH8_MAGGI|nr:uncharacterized protein LOC105324648 [Crassostrea gigas]
MTEDLAEELSVIQAIYCRQGECSMNDLGNCPELMVRLQREGEITPSATVVMQFSSLYPEQPPTISCQSQNRSWSRQLVAHLTELGKQLQGGPMVSEILNQAQEILDQFRTVGENQDTASTTGIDGGTSEAKREGPVSSNKAKRKGPVSSNEAKREGPVSSNEALREGPVSSSEALREGPVSSNEAQGEGPVSSSEAQGEGPVSSSEAQGEGPVTALLMLDHMRSKVRYTHTILKWATGLALAGCLLFVGKFIFIVLQGHAANVKEYIKLQRSSNVDVDSHGKKCKERMMSVLHQGIFLGKGFKDFSVIECSNQQEVLEIFRRTELVPLYEDHIVPRLRLYIPSQSPSD